MHLGKGSGDLLLVEVLLACVRVHRELDWLAGRRLAGGILGEHLRLQAIQIGRIQCTEQRLAWAQADFGAGMDKVSNGRLPGLPPRPCIRWANSKSARPEARQPSNGIPASAWARPAHGEDAGPSAASLRRTVPSGSIITFSTASRPMLHSSPCSYSV